MASESAHVKLVFPPFSILVSLIALLIWAVLIISVHSAAQEFSNWNKRNKRGQSPFILFEEDFDDGNYTGWGTNGTWSAANGYMANSRYASGASQFYRSRTAADAEFRYSYSNEDTSNSDYYVRTDLRYRTSGQATVEFLPSTVRIRECVGVPVP